MKEISFWGMIFGADGIKPDPTKVAALEYITLQPLLVKKIS